MSSPIGRALFFVALSAAPIAWAGPPDSLAKRPARSPEVTRAPEELLRSFERENRLVTANVRAEVEGELRDASAGMANDPLAAQTRLKSLIERVIQLPQLPAAERASLRGQLETALREANRRAVTKDALDAQVAAERAAAQDRLRVVEVLARNQQRLKQLMDRFDALMDERRWEAADGLAAEVIAETDQDAPIAASARFVARQVGAHLTNVALRDARQKGVVATLASVDTAHLPFPGDQPVIYPQAADWQELSQRRHQAAIESLRSHSKSEATIVEQLREPTAMEFIETPLEDVVAYLKDLHGIEIQLDRKALEDANLGGDAPVTIAVQGISPALVAAADAAHAGADVRDQG